MFICDIVLYQGQDSLHQNSHCEHQRFEYLQEIHQNCRVLVDFTIILYQCEGISLIDTACAVSLSMLIKRAANVLALAIT
jgi:hypothetical protein